MDSQKSASSAVQQRQISASDAETLRKLGKKPVLRRNFGFMSILGFATALTLAWETTLIACVYGLTNGGPAGFVYEYTAVWVGITLSFVVISELASMAPVSGGQYHWVSILAPKKYSSLFSYITGWLTVCGWQGNVAVTVYNTSTMIQGVAIITHPEYDHKPWHALLIAIGLLILSVLINTRGGVLLPRFEGTMLIVHILGFFAIIIPLLVIAPKQSAEEVFESFQNNGGQPTMGVSFVVGMVGSILIFCGADGSIHMSEEIENAAIVVPKAIIITYIVNGLMGLVTIISFLFAASDVTAAIASPTGYPYMAVFLQGTGSRAGTAVMSSIVIIMCFWCMVSSMATASRQLWSFSRDRAVPGWRKLSIVESRTCVPIYSVLVTAMVALLLQLINLGSITAFEDLVSITIAGLYSSYLVAVALLLWRRVTGAFASRSSIVDNNDDPLNPVNEKRAYTSDADIDFSKRAKHPGLTNTTDAPLSWGPWHIPGALGVGLNVFVCCFLLFAWFWSFWPTLMPVNPVNMNYNCVIWGGVVALSLIYYAVSGHKHYHGPIIEVDEEEPLSS